MNDKKILIKEYQLQYEEELFTLLQNEGEEWSEYWKSKKPQYQKALQNSLAYLIFENNTLCGYLRLRDDDGFGIYIYDLLVDKNFRGNHYGKMLMDYVLEKFPNDEVYVMSDVDEYYKRFDYEVEGTIFSLK